MAKIKKWTTQFPETVSIHVLKMLDEEGDIVYRTELIFFLDDELEDDSDIFKNVLIVATDVVADTAKFAADITYVSISSLYVSVNNVAAVTVYDELEDESDVVLYDIECD